MLITRMPVALTALVDGSLAQIYSHFPTMSLDTHDSTREILLSPVTSHLYCSKHVTILNKLRATPVDIRHQRDLHLSNAKLTRYQEGVCYGGTMLRSALTSKISTLTLT